MERIRRALNMERKKREEMMIGGWGEGEVKFSLTELFKEIKRGERVSYANVL